MPKLLSIIVDVFGKPKHDHHPNLVRFDFDVAMLHIRLKKWLKETVFCSICKLCIFHVSKYLSLVVFLPKILPLSILVLMIWLFSWKLLYWNSSVSLIYFFKLYLFVLLKILFLFLKSLPNFIKKGHYQLFYYITRKN
jgi:hypothetical protein